MNYQTQLPFNPHQPQAQPIQFTLDRPPFIPQGIQIPQNLSYLLPNVCSLVANEACANMGKNAGRMFTFNQLSANNYQNADYATAVATVFDVLMLGLAKGMYNVPEVGLNDSVSRTMSILTCKNIALFQGLAQLLDPRALQEASQMLSMANGMQQEIGMMKARYSAPPQNQWNNQASYGAVPSGFAGAPTNYGTQNSMPFSRFNDPAPQNQQWGNNQSGPSPFTRGSGQVNTGPIQDTNDRYSYLSKGVATQPQIEQHVFQQTKPEPMLVKAPEVSAVEVKRDLKWSSSHHQYHQPAFNTETEKLELYELVDGNKIYVIAKVVTKGVNEVDRTKHTLTTPMLAHTSHIPDGSPTREAAFEKSVERHTQTENPVLNKKAAVHNNVLIRTFIEELIFDTKVAQKMVKPENDCGVFRMNCIKGTPFVATKDIGEIANKLSAMKNFQEIALTMQSILNSDTEQEIKDFIFELDLFLTKEVNNLLQNKMSIEMSIDSFIDDICDLSEYLNNRKGATFSNAFDKCQLAFIETYLTPIRDQELVLDMQNSLIDPEEGTDISLHSVFYWHSYTITSVRMHSSELRIGISEKSSNIITEQSFPVLRNFCKKLFDSVAIDEHGIAHHVLVTSDNKKYELHQSLFVPDTYLISNFT